MTRRTFTATIHREGAACFVPVPFDPKPVFGKVRAPVIVTLNGYTYRSTIAAMGGELCLPLRRSNREAAGLEGGETLEVTLALDIEERTVEVPHDLAEVLAASEALRRAWDKLSFSHRREHVEALNAAKKPETRARRLARIIASLEA